MSQFIEMFGGVEEKKSLCVISRPRQWPTIQTKDFTTNGYFVYGANGIIGKYSSYNHEDETLTIACRGASCGAINLTSRQSYITGNAMSIDELSNEVKLKYLQHFLLYYDFSSIITGGAQPQITYANLRKVEVPIPPISLQNEFIAIAQQADKSKFVGFKSQFIEMFGACTHNVSLSTLCNVFIDGDWIESKDQSDVGIRLIQTGNIGDGYFRDKDDKARYISEQTFEHLKCTEVFPNDILISRLPDPIGRACVIPDGIGKSITAVDCTIVRLSDKILPEFFVAYTKTPMYQRQINEVATGTTRRRVSRANLGNIKITCPSLDKQQQFVDIVNQADKSKYFS